ncbi:MAG: hypothetical protein U1E65_11035 [Myxococcota bacterium]
MTNCAVCDFTGSPGTTCVSGRTGVTSIRHSQVGPDTTSPTGRSVTCRAAGTVQLVVTNIPVGSAVCTAGTVVVGYDMSTSPTGFIQAGFTTVQITPIDANTTYTQHYSFEWSFTQAPGVTADYYLRAIQAATLPSTGGAAACVVATGTTYAFTHLVDSFSCESVPDALVP